MEGEGVGGLLPNIECGEQKKKVFDVQRQQRQRN